jgi:hypothetical protein
LLGTLEIGLICVPSGTYGNMKFILGTKGKMLTVYTEDGQAFAATIINASPATVTQIKTKKRRAILQCR